MPETQAQTNEKYSELELRCLIEGDSVTFEATVPYHSKPNNLRTVILELRARTSFKNVDPYSLILWKVDVVLEGHDRHSLSCLRHEDLEGVEELREWKTMGHYWLDQPVTKHLQIIVEIHNYDILAKRPASEPAEGMFDRLKRSKLVTTAPPEIAKSAVYKSLQNQPSQKIFDNRPAPDADMAPIALLYEGFGQFLDITDARDNVPGLADVGVLELQKAVDGLVTEMTKCFDNEDLRRDAALPCLNRIFSVRRGIKIPQLHPAAIGSVNTYGHNIAIHGTGTAVVVVKNGVTGISHPEIEMVGYVARQHALGMNTEAGRQLYLRWRVPCMGLTIVGCDITFYAIIAIDHRFRLIALTHPISCIEETCGDHYRTALYLAFTAASVLQARILRDATELLNNSPAAVIPAHARRFPAVSELRKYPPSSGDYVTFEIGAFFPDRQSYRLVYGAVTAGIDKRVIIIKFTRRYSIELHEFCAKLDHAPAILAYERLPGGWYAVAMEYIESGITITHSDMLPTHCDRWTTELNGLVDAFHEKDLVHGDLRDANIVCNGDSVMLIDFDWGGKDGVALYPTPRLNDELLLGRVSDDLKIRKEDDRRVLRNTLAKLR